MAGTFVESSVGRIVEAVKASAIERVLVIDLAGKVVASEASVQDCCSLNRCPITI